MRRPGVAVSLARARAVVVLLVVSLLTTAGDWPTYLHDAGRSAASVDESTLSTNNADTLVKSWTFKTGGIIAAEPAVVAGTVYIGSWDGYEYALDAATGALKWKTFLGITGPYACNPPSAGVSSGAAVVNGVAYVGGGDYQHGTNTYFYALDAGTGAILWTVNTGDGSATGGHYNWASPLIVGNFAYVGTASFGDCPLVQGQLLKVDLTQHAIVATATFVPSGEVGGGVWTSPAYDAATGTVYVSTGTKASADQTMSQAVVALSASDLSIESYWQIPENQSLSDADFGTGPTIVTDGAGNRLVIAMNKNGVLYAFGEPASSTTAINLAAGPAWQVRLDPGGANPAAGDGTVSNAAFANGAIYQATGNAVIGGQGFGGSVSAINPRNGAVEWQHPNASPVIPAIAYANGFIVDGEGSTLEVLDASSGTRLFSYTTAAPLYGAPAVANGQIIFGGTDGNVYAFGLPTSSASGPPPDPSCPSGWTCQDVGTPSPAGSEVVSSGSWTISSGGAGLGGAGDSLRLLTQPMGGDVQLTALAGTLPSGSTHAQEGLIIRQTGDPVSPFYAAYLTGSGSLAVAYRVTPAVVAVVRSVTVSIPSYIAVQRVGDQFQASASTDGITYTLIPGTTVAIAMPASILAGLAAASGANGTAGTAQLSQVTVGTPAMAPVAAPTGSCPSGWSCGDVGNPSLTGGQSLSGGTWTVQGAGNLIANQSDQFHYVWQSLTGDGTITARVSNQTKTNGNAEAGIMFRQNTAANAPSYALLATPANGITTEYRAAASFNTLGLARVAGAAPVYLKVSRIGSAFTSYTSSDGITWTSLGTSEVMTNLLGTLLVGLAVSSHNAGVVGSAQFDTVSINATAPLLCPSGWSCADIGGPTVQGSDAQATGSWTVQGGGGDIWGTGDQFHFDWQSLGGDGGISACVTSQSNSSPWAKAGLMLRSGPQAFAAYYDAVVTPGNGITVQYRGFTSGSAVQQSLISGVAPTCLMIARTGTTFNAYTSADGATWTAVAGSALSLPDMSGTLLAGLAVTGHNTSSSSTVVFHAVSVSTSTTVTTATPTPTQTSTVTPTGTAPGGCPAGWACADIGNPTVPGSDAVANGNWTVTGGGGDIWGTGDQLRFDYQSLSADGNVQAQVVSQTNSDPWAKAGVMLRGGTGPGAAFYDLLVTPSNGINVQYRSPQGVKALALATVSGSAPAYLQVSRSGTTFSAFTSQDGVAWTLVPGSTVPLTGLAGPVLAGLAVTAHNLIGSSTVNFTAVSVLPNTGTVTATPSASATGTASTTPTATMTSTATSTTTASPTGTPAATATVSATFTAVSSATSTATTSATLTAAPSTTSTATASATFTAVPSATNSPTLSASPERTGTPTPTVAPATPTATYTPITGGTLFSDDFEADQLGAAPANWAATGGTWTVTQDQSHVAAETRTVSPAAELTAGSPAWTNYMVSIAVKAPGGTAAFGILGRWHDFNDTYMLLLRDGTKWQLAKRVAGAFSQIGSGSFTPVTGAWYTLGLTFSGSTITASINSTVLKTIKDVSLTSGMVGFHTLTAVEYDSVAVTGG